MFFANALAVLAKVASNGVSTFSFWGFFDETECPEEML
jgi:cyclic lactone autoinducer peptide